MKDEKFEFLAEIVDGMLEKMKEVTLLLENMEARYQNLELKIKNIESKMVS